jgi:histo-blood group ABO system transferase
MNVGLLLIATGKYEQFVQPLLDSERKYFLPGHKVTFFLFTDSSRWTKEPDVVTTFQKHEPFPNPTLKRYETFVTHKELFATMDYLFYCDVDMLFVSTVGDEILSALVATIHPGFLGARGTPETRKESTACIHEHEKLVYYSGAFNGGERDQFLKMCEVLSHNIQTDLNNRILAIWHDESYTNRYFVDNPPTKVLSASYCYPEEGNLQI